MNHPHQHAPGDRPAGHIRATRSVAYGTNGMIATSQALASAAGLKTLQDGGNAIDAALTAAAVLAVVEPSMTGIGGDLFAIVWSGKTRTLHGLDACGRSARRATAEEYAGRGLQQVPSDGPLAVTVPGVVEGWHQLASRFGSLALGKILEPAIRYARDGFPVQQILGADWIGAETRLSRDPAAARTFLPTGRAPRHGEIFANPNLAQSFELIARDGRDAFYDGPIARAIAEDMKARNGLLDERDFATHTADWIDTISTSYRGWELHEMPPSTQGVVALEMLNILEGYDLRAMGHNSADYLHLVAEAKKIAFADRSAYLADRNAMPAGVLQTLISKDYAASRRAEIALRTARSYTPAQQHVAKGDTVYLTAADGNGNVVSFIQSLFGHFGAGIVAGETGIALQNRGSGFTLAKGHPNQLAPHKRPLHTLVPAMLLKDGKPWVSFGVMGGDNQAQAHAQLVTKLVDFEMDIQTAGESARMRHGDVLWLESAIGADIRADLEGRGHVVRDGRGMMGGFQGIMIDPHTGVLMGGSDPRKDGVAVGW
jgi:gamma-glutamyltranspeptidase/glutathione hydrolase